MLEGFGKPDGKREAALSEFGKQLGSADLELDDDEQDPSEMARRAAGKGTTASAKPATPPSKPTASAKPAAAPVVAAASTSDVRPTLEPISDDTHKHRRLPTQPPSALELDIDRPADRPAPATTAPVAGTAVVAPRLPTAHASRQSPAPVRRGLFSSDRVTNLLASVALGLLVMVFPAKQFALRYELREVEPLLADLDGAVDHPLGVQAGLVADPQKIAAQIHEGRDHVRRRYMAMWLLVGLPIGLGLGFAPRPGD